MLLAMLILVLLDVTADFEDGVRLFREGRYAEALERFERVLAERDEPEAHANAAACLYRLGRHAEAVAHLRAALKKKPDRQAYRLQLVRALAASGKLDAARKELASCPLVKDLRELLRTVAMLEGLEGAAGEALVLSVLYALGERDRPLVLRLAGLLLACGRGREAATLLRRRLTEDPADARARLLLAHVLLAEGRLRAAATQAEVASALGAKDAARLLAHLWRRLDCPRLAAAALLAASPTGQERLDAAAMYLAAADPDGALKALADARPAARVHLLRARACLAKGGTAAAKEAAEAALAAEESAEAHVLLARALAAAGDEAAAKKHLERALEMEPGNAEAKSELDALGGR